MSPARPRGRPGHLLLGDLEQRVGGRPVAQRPHLFLPFWSFAKGSDRFLMNGDYRRIGITGHSMMPVSSKGSDVRSDPGLYYRGKCPSSPAMSSSSRRDPVIGRVFLAKPAFPADGRLLLGGGVVHGTLVTAAVVRKTECRVILSIRPGSGNTGEPRGIVDVQCPNAGERSSAFSLNGHHVHVHWADAGSGAWRADVIEAGSEHDPASGTRLFAG